MSGSVEGSHGSSKGGVDISLRGGHVSNSSSGTVEFVLSVEDEQDIKSFHNLGVGEVVLVGGGLVHHVEEVFNVTKVFLRLVDRLSSSVSVASSSDSGGHSKNSVNVFVSLLLGVVNVSSNVGGVSLGVERTKSSHKSGHHSHGVGVVSEGFDEGLKTSMVGRVLHDLSIESRQLFSSGEFSEDDQETSLQESRFLRELFNRIASVFENSFISINPRDSRDARDGVHEGRVE